MQKALNSERLNHVDALRGFALLGIIIVHFIEQYYAGAPPPDHANYAVHNSTDGVFDTITNILVRGKFFMLFSFLFGLSFALQMQHAADRQEDFRGRFVWRLVLLFAIGVLHHCFYRGDILTVFALLGLPMVLFYNVPNRWLLTAFGLLMLGLPRVIISYFQQGNPFENNEAAEKIYWEAAKNGGILDIFWQNLTLGTVTKWDAQFGFFGRGYQTLALFLLGLYAGRIRFFDNPEEKRAIYRKGLFWSLGIFLGIFAIGALLFAVLKIHERLGEKMGSLIGLAFYDVSNLAHMSFYIFAFLLLLRKAWWQRQLLKLAPYGRMALTNYFMQSVIGTTILFGFGFGKLGDYGATVMVIVSLIVYVLQLNFSKWWLTQYNFGPLEWLWRSATYGKWQNFKKNTLQMSA
jgi:uncharacterized protein